VVTAGNASPPSDGASAIVVASGAAVGRLGLEPRARVVGGARAGVPPHPMGLGPVPATEKLLTRHGLTVRDLDAVELNEAFAAQVLACVRRLRLDEEGLNADGGAIALGHPLGSSGCRLLVTLLGRLEREGGRRARHSVRRRRPGVEPARRAGVRRQVLRRRRVAVRRVGGERTFPW
jgi:acetyl-CoA acetyltransferase